MLESIELKKYMVNRLHDSLKNPKSFHLELESLENFYIKLLDILLSPDQTTSMDSPTWHKEFLLSLRLWSEKGLTYQVNQLTFESVDKLELLAILYTFISSKMGLFEFQHCFKNEFLENLLSATPTQITKLLNEETPSLQIIQEKQDLQLYINASKDQWLLFAQNKMEKKKKRLTLPLKSKSNLSLSLKKSISSTKLKEPQCILAYNIHAKEQALYQPNKA